MRRLIKVDTYVYRACDIESLFVASEGDWECIQKFCAAEGTVYFGEIAGKYSDVSVCFALDDFKVVSTDQNFIDKFEEIVGNRIGHPIVDRMNFCDRCDKPVLYEDDILCDDCRDQENS